MNKWGTDAAEGADSAAAADAAASADAAAGAELSALQDRLVRELRRAVHDRHHAWRTPTLATVDAQGLPQARTVVLRACDEHAVSMTVFTDARSPKVRELQQHPGASLLFWSTRLQMQLRVQVKAQVMLDGPLVDAAWNRVKQGPAAADYLAPTAPGSVWPAGSDGGAREPAAKPQGLCAPQAVSVPQPVSDAHHLAVLQFHARQWDWLELRREGHRRAAWVAEDTDPPRWAPGCWLQP